MTTQNTFENHHGVLLQIAGQGVFITGPAGIGKSSLALECLHHGHQLIADDSVEFALNANKQLIGNCPELLSGLLHTRELGLINVVDLFGKKSWIPSSETSYIIDIKGNVTRPSTLESPCDQQLICTKPLPRLSLSITNPASLYHRLMTWLNMHASSQQTEQLLIQRQQKQMSVL